MNYSIIGISGLPGAGKSQLISRLLNLKTFATWKSISTGDILRKEYTRLRKDGLFGGTFQRYLASFRDDEIRVLNKNISQLVSTGQWIIDSRYVIENCKDRTDAAHIFLTAPLGIRAERKARDSQGKVSRQAAEIDLINREKWEVETGIRIYNYDYRVRTPYKLVFDTSRTGIKAETLAIESLMQ